MIFISVSCSFFFNELLIFGIIYILVMNIFFSTFFALVKMPVCHLRMFIEHTQRKLSATFEANFRLFHN